MNYAIYFRRLIALSFFSVLVACGGSGGGETEETPTTPTPTEPPAVAEPVISQLFFRDSEVEVVWTHPLVANDSSVDISYRLYYAEEQIENDVDENGQPAEEDLSLADLQARINALAGSMVVENATSPLSIPGTNNTPIYFVITATTADGTSDPSNELRATPRNYTASNVISTNLNDTGYVSCGDYAYTIDVDNNGSFDESVDIRNSGDHNNGIDCAMGAVDAEGDTIPEVAAQDLSFGRDAMALAGTLTKTGSGISGFDFTKLDSNGAALAASAESWSCVQDNHTGLVWEVKTTEGLHNAADRYTWYNTDDLQHGGSEGAEQAALISSQSNDTCSGYDESNSASFCNTQAFVERVNAAGLCGANDWRMPTREELFSIINFHVANETDQADPIQNPSVDTNFFPNTQVTRVTGVLEEVRYLSASPSASNPANVWAVYFAGGGTPALPKGLINAVRLVRSAP